MGRTIILSVSGVIFLVLLLGFSSTYTNVFAENFFINSETSCDLLPNSFWIEPNICQVSNLNLSSLDTLTVGSNIHFKFRQTSLINGDINNRGTVEVSNILTNNGKFTNLEDAVLIVRTTMINDLTGEIENRAVFQIDGTVENNGRISNQGTLNIDGNALLSSGIIGNNGIINNNNILGVSAIRDIPNGGLLSNGNGGVINNFGSFRTGGQVLLGIVTPSLIKNDQSTINNYGEFTVNRGVINNNFGTILNSGSIIFTGSSSDRGEGLLTNIGGVFENSGRVEMWRYGVFDNSGSGNFLHNGTLNNSGQVLSIFGGRISNNFGSQINNYCTGTIDITSSSYSGNSVNEILCIPVLVAPNNPSTILSQTPLFEWENNPVESRAITQYEWRINHDSDPNGTPIQTKATSSQSHTPSNLDPGDYLWSVRATNADLSLLPYPAQVVASDFPQAFSLKIENPNLPPVADAGGPYIGEIGLDLELDGSGSSDPDSAAGDRIVSWEWDIDDDGLFDDATGDKPTIPSILLDNLPRQTPNTIQLRVTDTFGAQATDSTELRIFVNQPTADFEITPEPAAAGQQVTFDASSSSHSSPLRQIVSWEWDFGDGNTASGEVVTHTYSSFGTFDVTLEVTDDNSPAKTNQKTIQLEVLDINPPLIDLEIIPLKTEEDEGTFQVKFDVTDEDPNPLISAKINDIAITNGQILKLEVDDESESKFKEAKQKQCEKDRKKANERIAKGKTIGGQLQIKLLICEANGTLNMEASSFLVTVTATDASGNTSTTTGSPQFSLNDEDDGDKEKEDDDD